MPTLEQIRYISRVAEPYGLKLPVAPVCREHHSPATMVAQVVYDRPSFCLWRGPRGGGKSAGAGFSGFLQAGWHEEFHAKILGGSLAQSEQIYRAMDIFRDALPGADIVREMLATKATFANGATIEMLTASPKSVRGPHVPQLYLDEVDEIEDEIRQHAMGMAMARGRLKSSVVMTSTWHKVAGPMAALVREAEEEGTFPVGTFCMFDVLERCPEERSGRHLEKCPECPLLRWCHAGIDEHPSRLPKAKRSCGHYDIDAFIQKTVATSLRVFESDYLCLQPRAPGQWFKDYDESRHVAESADYDPRLPFHTSIDTGVHTGAVFFQVRRLPDGSAKVNVFGDYYSENVTGDQAGGAEAQGRAIVALCRELTGQETAAGRLSMDSASRQRNGAGYTVIGEYQRAGCIGRGRTIEPWQPVGPGNPKADTLQLVEAFLLSAGDVVGLTIHPRCRGIRDALRSYVRKKRDDQWTDEPEDPQHPHENLIDALAGGLKLEFPEGRLPGPQFIQRRPRDVI